MKPPKVSRFQPDWSAAEADLIRVDGLKGLNGSEALSRLNEAVRPILPGTAESAVPVLLPVNSSALLQQESEARSAPFLGFHAPSFFLSGPSGYDAVFSLSAGDMRQLGIVFPDRVDIHLSGAAFLYDLNEPNGIIEWPTNGIEAEFPGLRRVFLENYVRYVFQRYGVPYAVSIACFDGRARHGLISCRQADKVAIRFLNSLQVAGGMPHDAPEAAPAMIERPTERSAVFTYYAPGDLVPASGPKGKGIAADYTVYSNIRFPLADAPAFANSQRYGPCEGAGRVGANGAAAYPCGVKSGRRIWNEGAPENFAYPWRDNFCERRAFYVGQCPGGMGHQGQDIRPGSCKQRDRANRCEPYQHEVVAARDGVLLRSAGQMGAFLVVNAPNEHVRFRYLHMSPKLMDADGVLSGRRVAEGERLGKVGNFEGRENGTTYHLHFDLQVPTRYGWVFVDPYLTLVAAYERQIRGRGREIKENGGPPPTALQAPPLAAPTAERLHASAPAAANPNQTAVDWRASNRFDPETAPHDHAQQVQP